MACAASTAASALLPACAGSDNAPFLPTDVQSRLQQVLEQNRILFRFPGVQAGVWTAQGAWVGVSGLSETGGNRPPSRQDHTRIGSITKTFTVAVLLQLAEQKLVSLDDPIGKYLPGLPNGDTATLRMLASMTSGIPSYTSDETFLRIYFSNPQAVFTPQQLLAYLRGKAPDFAAGTRVSYSNSNTVALGLVIERIAHMPFAQAVKEHLLDPLGMNNTLSAGTSNLLPIPHWRGITTQGYPDGMVKDATDWNPSWTSTAGDMISTLDDLHTWAVALGTGRGIVSSTMQQEREASMHSSVPPNSPHLAYALGFGVYDGWIGHTGELPGFNTSVRYDPRTHTAVVVMVNSDISAVIEGVDVNPAPTITTGLIAALAS